MHTIRARMVFERLNNIVVYHIIRRLLLDAAVAAKPVEHRGQDLHQDDQRSRRELGRRAPGLVERRSHQRDSFKTSAMVGAVTQGET